MGGIPPEPAAVNGEAAARRCPVEVVAAARVGVIVSRAGPFGEAMRLVGRVEGLVAVLRVGPGMLGSDTKPGVDFAWALEGGM